MLELDLILLPFFEKCYMTLSNDEKQAFNDLLDEPDPDLYNFLLGYAEPEQVKLKNIVGLIREFKQTKTD
jgi:antitoxin CptB